MVLVAALGSCIWVVLPCDLVCTDELKVVRLSFGILIFSHVCIDDAEEKENEDKVDMIGALLDEVAALESAEADVLGGVPAPDTLEISTGTFWGALAVRTQLLSQQSSLPRHTQALALGKKCLLESALNQSAASTTSPEDNAISQFLGAN